MKQRLLEAGLEEPEILPEVLPFLSTAAGAEARIKELYDKEQNNPESQGYWREKVQKWLFYNSKYFLGDLLAQANKITDTEKTGGVEHEEALIGLARVDWQTAEPLLNKLAAGVQIRSGALALTLLYRHAIAERDASAEDRYRDLLKTIAANRAAPGCARDTAIEALSLSEWSGRDQWYLSLFHDDTLVDMTDGHHAYSPLTTLFAEDPDKWIPVMARLVESKEFAVAAAPQIA